MPADNKELPTVELHCVLRNICFAGLPITGALVVEPVAVVGPLFFTRSDLFILAVNVLPSSDPGGLPKWRFPATRFEEVG